MSRYVSGPPGPETRATRLVLSQLPVTSLTYPVIRHCRSAPGLYEWPAQTLRLGQHEPPARITVAAVKQISIHGS